MVRMNTRMRSFRIALLAALITLMLVMQGCCALKHGTWKPFPKCPDREQAPTGQRL